MTGPESDRPTVPTRAALPLRLLEGVLVLLLFLVPLIALAGPATAASCGRTAQGPADVTSAVQTSSSSQIGTNNTMTVTVVNAEGSPVAGYCVDFTQNVGPSSGWPRSGTSDNGGQASVTWTSATTSPGNATDSITAVAIDANREPGQTQMLQHTWTAKPTPSPSPSPSPST